MAKKRSTQSDAAAWRDAQQRILESLDLAAEFAALGVNIASDKPNRNGWLECHAVGREDNTPSAAVNVAGSHPLLGRYKDSGEGQQAKTISFFDFAAAHANGHGFKDWKEARTYYADKAGVKLPESDEHRRPSDRLDFLEWNDMLAALWCNTKEGVTVDALKLAGARLAKWPAGSTNATVVIAVPGYGPHLREDDPTCWVLWAQSGRPLVLLRKGKPPEEKKMLVLDNGWIVVGDLATALIVWKVEGPTDLLTILAHIPPDELDYTAVVTNACGAGEYPDPQMLAHLAGKTVRLVHDADRPGQDGASEKWCPAIAGVAAEVRNVQLPYEIQPKHGKDLRDWFNEGHTYEDLLDRAAATEPFEAPPTATGEPEDDGFKPNEADDDPHRLARVNLGKLRSKNRDLKFWRDEWYVWKGPKYRKITTQEFRAKLAQSIKEEFDRLSIQEQQLAGDNAETSTAKKVTRTLTTNVMEATAGMTVISSSVEQMTWLPDRSRRHYISMANGILDLDALLADSDDYLLPHSPDWFSVVSLPYEFQPEAECPRWLKFLEHNLEGDQERIRILQEWAGYLLLPDTGQQKFLLMEGEGSNGKSVYLAAITAMLGDENVSNVPLEVFGDRFSRTETIGKLANIAGDCEDMDKVAEGYIKSFTSGDRMYFDRKGIAGINCVPTARMMVSCNERPKFRDRSRGIWRRMILVPWRIKIEDDKKVPNMDKPAWWRASGELPGIFWWALKGRKRLQDNNRFTESAVSSEAKGDYQIEMNSARAFINELTEPADGEFVRADWLYKLYSDWARSGNYKPFGRPVFGKELQRAHPTAKRVQRRQRKFSPNDPSPRHWCYLNLRLTNNAVAGTDTNDPVYLSNDDE